MGLKSMTGYGCGEASAAGLKIRVELSSVNRKHLDVRVNLPRSLTALESRVFEAIHAAVARGTITGTVTVSVSDRARRSRVVIDRDLAGAYIKEIRKATAGLGVKDDLSASSLLVLPDVVRYECMEEDVDAVWPVLSRALRAALNGLVRMRRKEGMALARDLRHRLGTLLVGHLDAICRHAPEVAARYRAGLEQRLRQAGFGAQANDPQLLRELALFAERCDICEETTRITSHLRQALQLLRSAEPSGRTLDFLAQEMLREINTVGSKANDAAIVRHVIHFKTELERIREQVQNVE